MPTNIPAISIALCILALLIGIGIMVAVCWSENDEQDDDQFLLYRAKEALREHCKVYSLAPYQLSQGKICEIAIASTLQYLQRASQPSL